MNMIRYDKNGPAKDVLYGTDSAVPEPGPGQVRVKMVLSPVHNHDIITVAGGYGVTPDLPAQAGSEALGVIDKLGDGVSGFAPGDRVIAAGLTGTWADFYIANAARLVLVPAGLPDALAAQLAGMPFDALLAFNAIGAKAGEWLIINAANGAVGKAIMQIARSKGVNAIGLVHKTESKMDLVREGFSNIFVTTDKDWPVAAKAAIGAARVAGGLDMVGGALVAEMTKLFSPGATILVLGAMSNEPIKLDAAPVIFGELVLKGFWAMKEASRIAPEQVRALVEDVITLAQNGQIELPVAATYPLSKIKEAMIATNQTRNGKVLLTSG